MAYVSVPKDLSTVKTKVVLNLTKRQLICFSAALAVGLPLFFLTKDSVGTSASSLLMIFSMLPLFMFALYEKHGQPLEVILRHLLQDQRTFLRLPKNLKDLMIGQFLLVLVFHWYSLQI